MRRNNNEEIKRLAGELRLHRYLYYNKQPRISDQIFDALMQRMRQIDPTNEVLKETGSPADKDSGWPKANHHYAPLKSLDNAMTVDEFSQWVARLQVKGRVCVLEDKFDGLTVELFYDEGNLVQAITRGDGNVGEDITINVKKMKFVKTELKEKITASLRGEIMLFSEDFKEITKTENYANPRNAASGICKRFDGKYCDKLCVVLYDMVSPDITFSWETEKMDYIAHTLDLVTANYKLISPPEVVVRRQEYMDKIRSTLPYNIDGLVIKINSIQTQKEAGFLPSGDPKAMVAFKFDARGVATQLLDIEYTVGRTGIITPNGVLDPINIDGSMVKAASIHNVDELERLKIGVGDLVLVVKAGEIIPKITAVIKSAGKSAKVPTKCPACGGPVVKRVKDGKEGANLYCDSDDCVGKEFRRLRHWVDILKKRMGLDGIGESTIEQMYEKGLIKDPSDYYTLTADKIADLERSGDKAAKKIVDGFERCKEIDIVTFLAGLGIPTLGPELAEVITEEYDLYSLMEEVTADELTKIPGIGPQRAKEILDGLEKRRPLIEKLTKIGVKIKIASKDIKLESNKLNGKSFQVTGALSKTDPKTNKSYRREDWYELVQKNGGKISKVNKELDYLIVIRSSSNKVKKASTLGIKMISESDFWTMME